jgi:hypothetical protein
MEELLEELKREAEELRLRIYLEKYGEVSKLEKNRKLINNN